VAASRWTGDAAEGGLSSLGSGQACSIELCCESWCRDPSAVFDSDREDLRRE